MKYYDKVTKARKILGIPEFATLTEVKHRYHELIKSIHPDVSEGNLESNQQKSAEINEAYEIIMQYCEQFKLSFTREDVNKYRPAEEFWFEKFGDDPTC